MDEKWHMQQHLDITATLKEVGDDIDELKGDNREFKSDIKHLCENLKNLTAALWAVLILILGTFVTNFFTK